MTARPRPRPGVADMLGYHSPQVDVRVRLNTNESPFEPPREFTEALAARVRDINWNRYPTRSAAPLRAAIADLHGTSPEQVFAANGSNEVIQSLLLAYAAGGGRVGVFTPSYALHSHIARVVGAEVVTAPRGDDFRVGADAVRSFVAAERPAVLFLCSPNNPTGTVETPHTVRAALDAMAASGGVLVVDEAYGPFSTLASGEGTAADLVDEKAPLVVCRTFSKAWSLAAARLGYALAPSWLVAELQKVVLPYHLATMTQEAGLLCLRHRTEMTARTAAVVAEREHLAEGLGALATQQWPSGANFILFRPLERPGAEVWQALLERSVLVRDCSSWEGLAGCLRVTVGTPEENTAFLAALADVLR